MKKVMIVVVVALVAGMGGVAAGQDSSVEIHACVTERPRSAKGDIRIVDDPSQCTAKESPLSWDRSSGPPTLNGTVYFDDAQMFTSGSGFTVTRVGPGDYFIEVPYDMFSGNEDDSLPTVLVTNQGGYNPEWTYASLTASLPMIIVDDPFTWRFRVVCRDLREPHGQIDCHFSFTVTSTAL